MALEDGTKEFTRLLESKNNFVIYGQQNRIKYVCRNEKFQSRCWYFDTTEKYKENDRIYPTLTGKWRDIKSIDARVPSLFTGSTEQIDPLKPTKRRSDVTGGIKVITDMKSFTLSKSFFKRTFSNAFLRYKKIWIKL